MERYCPPGTAHFVPANKISPKFKQVQESFLSPKLFSAIVKKKLRFLCLMEPEKASTRMKTKKTNIMTSFKNTFCNKNRQTQKFVLNEIIVFSAFISMLIVLLNVSFSFMIVGRC